MLTKDDNANFSIRSWKTCEIEQQIKFGFTPDFIEAVLSSASYVKDYAYIVHDKDVKIDGTPKEPHVHLMMRFSNAVPTYTLLNKFDNTVFLDDKSYKTVEYQHLNRCHSWKSAIAYLTHANATDKHLYDDKEVISNFEWQTLRDEALSLYKGRLAEILKGIEDYSITEYNINDFTSFQERVKYKKTIEDAFKVIKKNKDVDRNMRVIYCYGDSGTGKTTWAKDFCRMHNYQPFISGSAKDPLDGYNGEPVIILDDLRGDSFTFAELLKFLDNNTASKVHSRYEDKVISAKIIIITSVLELEDLYRNVTHGEPSKQIKRRAQTVMHFTHSKIYTSLYHLKTDTYIPCPTQQNYITATYDAPVPSAEDVIDTVADLFDGLLEVDKTLCDLESTVSEECSSRSFDEDVPPVDDDLPNPFI